MSYNYSHVPPRKGYLTGCEIEETEVRFTGEVWATADREVAFALVAIRRVLDGGELARMPDGSILVPLPNGLCAVVDMHVDEPTDSAPATHTPVATIEIEKLAPGKGVSLKGYISSGISTHGQSLSYCLPRAIRLTNGEISLRLWFEAAPLLLSSSVNDLATAAGALGGAEATAEADRRRQAEEQAEEQREERRREEEERQQLQAAAFARQQEEEEEERRRQEEEDYD